MFRTQAGRPLQSIHKIPAALAGQRGYEVYIDIIKLFPRLIIYTFKAVKIMQPAQHFKLSLIHILDKISNKYLMQNK